MHFLLDNMKKKLYNSGWKGVIVGYKSINVVENVIKGLVFGWLAQLKRREWRVEGRVSHSTLYDLWEVEGYLVNII